MSVTLTPEVQQFVDNQIASGAFRDSAEVLKEAMRALRDQQERAEKRVALIADLEQGIQSLDKGQGIRTTAREILTEVMQG